MFFFRAIKSMSFFVHFLSSSMHLALPLSFNCPLKALSSLDRIFLLLILFFSVHQCISLFPYRSALSNESLVPILYRHYAWLTHPSAAKLPQGGCVYTFIMNNGTYQWCSALNCSNSRKKKKEVLT